MNTSIRVAPPNALVLLMDPSVGQVPNSMSGSLVASTSTCVAVGTLSEHDGTTRISLEAGEYEGSSTLVFDGVLETPGARVVVCSVLGEIYLEMDVMFPQAKAQIWANDDGEPNEIDIRITSPSAAQAST